MRSTEPAAYPSDLEDYFVLPNRWSLYPSPATCEENTVRELYDQEIVGLASLQRSTMATWKWRSSFEDGWQRQRLGTALAGRLVQAAEARGFHRFIANVRSDNVAIQKLVKNLGDVVSTK